MIMLILVPKVTNEVVMGKKKKPLLIGLKGKTRKQASFVYSFIDFHVLLTQQIALCVEAVLPALLVRSPGPESIV